MRTPPRFALVAGLTAVSALTLAGCSGSAPQTAGDGPSVVTTTTQVTDFTQRLLEGVDASITNLLGPGRSVHSFEATPADLAAIAAADAVVVSGAGLEEWLDDTLAAAGYTGPVIDASTGIELGGSHHHDHGTEDGHDHGGEDGHDHGTEGEDGHDHSTEGEDGHDHGAEATTPEPTAEASTGAEDDHDHEGTNPHIWTAPTNAERMVANIAEGLAPLEGVDASTIEANAAGYTAKLAELDAWITENMAKVPVEKRLLVTNHDGLYYYDRAYDITFVGSVMPSWDDNAEPSAADIDALVAAIREHGVTAVFTETQLSPEAIERIGAETGATVYSGEDALYTDALGEAGSAGASYIGATAHNTNVLIEAWGATPSELPAGLVDA